MSTKPTDPDALDNFRRLVVEALTQEMPLKGGGSMPRYLHMILKAAEEASEKGGKLTEFVIKELKDALSSRHNELTEYIKVAVEYKCKLQEKFDYYKRLNLPAPDRVPHPAHVIITEDGFRIAGPMDRESRRRWEVIKAGLHDLVSAINSTKDDLVDDPDNVELRKWLETLNRQRRKLMRLVPKGWDWREKIFTRDSDWQSMERVLEEARAENRAKMPAKLRAELGI